MIQKGYQSNHANHREGKTASFCGRIDSVKTEIKQIYGTWYISVGCDVCNFNRTVDLSGDCQRFDDMLKAMNAVTEMWNERPD